MTSEEEGYWREQAALVRNSPHAVMRSPLWLTQSSRHPVVTISPFFWKPIEPPSPKTFGERCKSRSAFPRFGSTATSATTTVVKKWFKGDWK